MNKTKIEWTDFTWSPVTGCLHGCEYCYARKIANRFAPKEKDNWDDCTQPGNGLHEIRYKNSNGGPFKYGFKPTLHSYRLSEPSYRKKPSKIFVCSMSDLFGSWVPDKWIESVFKACEAAPQHKYLFLTKNPKRYWELHEKGLLPEEKNCWFGATLTSGEDETDTANALPAYTGRPKPTSRNTFVSVEPILDNIEGNHPMGGFFSYYPNTIKWAILGAETGNRKNKVIPKREWVENIVSACHNASIPVFMKDSLKDLMGDDFIREWPEGLED